MPCPVVDHPIWIRIVRATWGSVPGERQHIDVSVDQQVSGGSERRVAAGDATKASPQAMAGHQRGDLGLGTAGLEAHEHTTGQRAGAPALGLITASSQPGGP